SLSLVLALRLLALRPPADSPLFPYTTLFRSLSVGSDTFTICIKSSSAADANAVLSVNIAIIENRILHYLEMCILNHLENHSYLHPLQLQNQHFLNFLKTAL